MRDPEEFQEIENLGEAWEEEESAEEQEAEKRKKGGFVPVAQAVLCVLILLLLAALKFSKPEDYGKAVEWYQREAARQIELPSFGEEEKAPSSQPPGSQAMGLLQEV